MANAEKASNVICTQESKIGNGARFVAPVRLYGAVTVGDNASNSNKGILWLHSTYGHIDRTLFCRGDRIEVSEDSTHDTSALASGSYKIHRAFFDDVRRRYHIELERNGEPVTGFFAKGKVSFCHVPSN